MKGHDEEGDERWNSSERGADGGQASGSARALEPLKGFAYHLRRMNELLAGWRLQEIEAAILAAAALASDGWNDELHGVDAVSYTHLFIRKRK